MMNNKKLEMALNTPMARSITITIVTVCKNAVDTIEKTIESVIHQSYADIEYLLIDGKSTDGTLDIIEKYKARNRNIKVFSESDTGIYAAMNKGIRLASGELIYFLNADDYLIDKDVIIDLIDFASHQSRFDLIYGNHEARKLGQKSLHCPVQPELMFQAVLMCEGELMQCATFFRKDIFERLSYFNENYRLAADHIWWFHFFRQPELVALYYPRTIASYAHGGASNNISLLFNEIFTFEKSVPELQQSEWLERRLHIWQNKYISLLLELEKIYDGKTWKIKQVGSALRSGEVKQIWQSVKILLESFFKTSKNS